MSTVVEREQPPVASARLWAGVVVAPIAWTVAELIGYVLTSRLCNRGATTAAGVTEGVFGAVLAVIAAAGLVTAVGSWRRVRDASRQGGSTAFGRAHFMALIGIVASALLTLNIVLFALAPVLVDPCNQVR